MNRRTDSTRGDGGFSLLETVIAMAILSVGAFGLLSASYSALSLQAHNQKNLDCQRVAAYAYAEFLQQRSDSDILLSAEEAKFSGSYPPNDRYSWEVRCAIDPEALDSGVTVLEVTVLVFDRNSPESDNSDGAAYIFRTFAAPKKGSAITE